MAELTIAGFAGRAMGSALRLTVGALPASAESHDVAAAWAEVVDEFEHAEQAMSRFRDASELTRLNRAAGTGRDVAVGRRLERAVIASDRARRLTGGRFDPRVLADLDRLGYRGVALRTGRVRGVGSTTAAANGDRIAWRTAPGRLRTDRPIDLGGIGKGLALRWATRRLDRRGLGSYLVEAGGDLVARGVSPDGADWRVGIEDPSDSGTPLAVIAARDTAVATSSVGVHAWVIDGQRVHHLLDPATGRPGGEGLLAVTVAAPDPVWAEVWSKTLFLAGRAGITEQARRHGFAAWWIDTDAVLEMTPAARMLTIWVAAEARPAQRRRVSTEVPGRRPGRSSGRTTARSR
jgi:thiamine biosynthesis lipoprotein